MGKRAKAAEQTQPPITEENDSMNTTLDTPISDETPADLADKPKPRRKPIPTGAPDFPAMGAAYKRYSEAQKLVEAAKVAVNDSLKALFLAQNGNEIELELPSGMARVVERKNRSGETSYYMRAIRQPENRLKLV